MNEYTLYSYWRSSCSWRVRWALEFKKISYLLKPVNLLKNEQYSKKYLDLNPNARLPTITLGNKNLSGSIAILEYLEEKHPERPLLPSDAFSRAKVRELVNIIACDTQPLQNLSLMKFHSEKRDDQIAYAKHWISRGIEAYEKSVKNKAGKFSVGDTLTIADICLIPQVYNAKRFKLDMESLPTINQIWSNSMELASCIASSPENQIDAT